MQLIAVNDDQLINPDKIVSVELRRSKGKETLIVRAEGRDYTVSNDSSKEFIQNLRNNGIVAGDQFLRM